MSPTSSKPIKDTWQTLEKNEHLEDILKGLTDLKKQIIKTMNSHIRYSKKLRATLEG